MHLGLIYFASLGGEYDTVKSDYAGIGPHSYDDIGKSANSYEVEWSLYNALHCSPRLHGT